MTEIVGLIDEVIAHINDEVYALKVKDKVNAMMKDLPLFSW